jgi:hypothetical protein
MPSPIYQYVINLVMGSLAYKEINMFDLLNLAQIEAAITSPCCCVAPAVINEQYTKV